MPPNPWVLFGGVLAFIGALIAGDLYGASHQKTKDDLVAEQRVAAVAAKSVEFEQRARSAESAWRLLNDKTEKDYADKDAQIALLAGRLDGLGKLRDRHATCPATSVPGNTGPAAPNSTSATGCQLSAELTGFLRSQFALADKAAEYAAACHDWAVNLKKTGEPDGR